MVSLAPLLVCSLVVASFTFASGTHDTDCYSYESTALIDLDPNSPTRNVFFVGLNETGPPFRAGAGVTFSLDLRSSRNTRATFRGANFFTSNTSIAHNTAEIEFLPGSAYSGALITLQGKYDFAAGTAAIAVTGGYGVFEGATGSFTASRVSPNLLQQTVLLRVNFCVPEREFTTRKAI